jgi:hypothetical protein
MALANGALPIIEIYPQDPGFQQFISRCTNAFFPPRIVTPPADPDHYLTPGKFHTPGDAPAPTVYLPSRPSGASAPRPPANSAPPVTETPAGLARLTIRSGYGNQPNPLSRVAFYLMREDISTTLKKAGFRVAEGASPKQVFSKVCGNSNDNGECNRLFNASREDPVAAVIAGSNGEATFQPVPHGEFYVLIYSYGPGKPMICWNERVALKPGENSFTAGVENAKPLK